MARPRVTRSFSGSSSSISPFFRSQRKVRFARVAIAVGGAVAMHARLSSHIGAEFARQNVYKCV